MRAQPGNWRQKLLLAVGGLGLGLVLAELVLVLADLPPAGPFLQEFHGPGFKLMCFDTDPSGVLDIDLADDAQRDGYMSRIEGDEFARFWRKTPHAVEIRFNAEGFREREFTAKAPGTWRIAVVGDSFTYGHGLPEEASWPRQLEGFLIT